MSLKSEYKEKVFLLKCLNEKYKSMKNCKQKRELENEINGLIDEIEPLYKKINYEREVK